MVEFWVVGFVSLEKEVSYFYYFFVVIIIVVVVVIVVGSFLL